MNKIKRRLTSSQIILLSFGAMILLGTFLLMLPVSSQAGQWTGFTDALFTATSASCVTGLIVKDTATYWSLFGQLVILTLIQIGGLGVVTMAVAVVMASGRKIGLFRRQTMQDAFGSTQIGGIIRLTGLALKGTAIVEMVGAVCYSFVFIPEFGFIKGIWYSVFHSISAFCNAGFDLMGVKAQFSSLTSYETNGAVAVVTALLILIGGLGFATWDDVIKHKLNFVKYRLQSKIALAGTVILVVLPFIYFLAIEFSSPQWAYLSGKDKFFAALFRAVTPRTAGFNTVDMTQFSQATIMITILLMMTGGNSGSTAGGMKISTVAVMLSTAVSELRKKADSSLFKRRIDNDVNRNALAIFTMYGTLFMAGSLTISIVENLPLLTCMFETASAVATVGLTLGITPSLSTISHLILTVLMYLGRVGMLTIVFATVKAETTANAKYPVEKITVG